MKRHKTTVQICVFAMVAFICALIFFYRTDACSPDKKMTGIEAVAQDFSAFVIPSDVRVVGIGEATHGNREFQLAKKYVFEKLVCEGNGRAICFEMAVGDAAMINDAVHSAHADLTEVLGKQSYPLYDTPEILSLLEWMRAYNQGLRYEDSLMIYGVDMQGAQTAIHYMQELCRAGDGPFTEEEKNRLLSMKAEEKDDYADDRAFFEAMHQRLLEHDDIRSRQLSVAAGCIIQSIDSPNFYEQPRQYSHYRDLCMGKNLKAYSEIEEARGYSQVVVTAHNGHVMKGGASALPGENTETMGDQINRLFEGSYFCIGTEFYEGYVNIHTFGTYGDAYHRADHFYRSDDPLAYQAKFFDDGAYCLDFSRVTEENTLVYKSIHSYIFNAIVGEGYTSYDELAKNHRIKLVPADRYDAVIYYYEVTPIHPIHYSGAAEAPGRSN